MNHVCIVCGGEVKPFRVGRRKNGKFYNSLNEKRSKQYPKTCSEVCTSIRKSEISRSNKHKVRWNSRPQERPSQYLEEVAERDYIEGILR